MTGQILNKSDGLEDQSRVPLLEWTVDDWPSVQMRRMRFDVVITTARDLVENGGETCCAGCGSVYWPEVGGVCGVASPTDYQIDFLINCIGFGGSFKRPSI